MYYEKFIFENYACYYDTVSIDVSVDKKSGKGIVLIGGYNGAGKTKCMQGVQLGLFGSRAPFLDKQKSYYQQINDLMNHRAYHEGKREFSITLVLSCRNFKGEWDTIEIKRTFRIQSLPFHGRKPIETVIVKVNGFVQTALEEEMKYNEFISKRIFPLDISKFFILDNELVMKIAVATGNKEDMITAMNEVLNLSTYQNLSQSLEKVKDMIMREMTNRDETDLYDLEIRKNTLRNERRKLSKQLEEFRKAQEMIQKDIDSSSDWLTYHEQSLSGNRHKLEGELETKKIRLSEIETKVFEQLHQFLPFMLLKPFIEQVSTRLKNETEDVKALHTYREQEKNLEIFEKSISEKDFTTPTLTGAQIGDLMGLARRLFSSSVKKEPLTFHYHRFSKEENDAFEEEKYQLFTKMDKAHAAWNELKKEKETLESNLVELTQKIKSLPSEKELSNEMVQLNQWKSKVQELNQKITLIQEKAEENLKMESKLQAEFSQLDLEVSTNGLLQKEIDLITKIQQILERYLHALRKQKTQEVLDFFMEKFQKSTRKQGYYKNFKINEETFEITYENMFGKEINKQNISEGEKQMFAMDILFAMIQASNRDFGIIIDTVAGRLDGIHRHSQNSQFFPYSNQMILLSTDQEIRREDYNLLLPNISKSYIIEESKYFDVIGMKEGYFVS